MTDDSEVARIANWLTVDKRTALLSLNANFGFPQRGWATHCGSLTKSGLCTFKYEGDRRLYAATPLGIRVKAYLESKGGEA